MRGKTVLFGLIVSVYVCSSAFGFDGHRESRQKTKISQAELLVQLPAEKEMLFHQAMRDARDKAQAMRAQIKDLRKEIKEVFLAEQFDENLYREKKKTLESLQAKKHENMEAVIVGLAKQFTAEERKILTQLLPQKLGFGRPSPKNRQP